MNCSSQGDFLAFSGFSLLTTGSYTLCGCILHVCIESKYLLPVSVCLFVCLFFVFFHERKRMVAACRISLMPRLYFAPHKIVVPYNWRGYCANRYKNCIPCHKSLIELDPQEMEVHNNMLKNNAPMKLKASIQTIFHPPRCVSNVLFYLTRTKTKSFFSNGEKCCMY